MIHHKIFVIFLLILLIFGCGQPQSTTEIDKDIAEINKQIEKAEKELKLYGGLVNVLISVRANILQNTKAMLEQKRIGIKRFININYNIEGKIYKQPDDIDNILKDIQNEIDKQNNKLEKANEEYNKLGGLVKNIKLVDIVTVQNSITMLEQKKILLKYGIPLYEISAQKEKTTKEPAAKKDDPKDLLIRGMIDVSLIELKYVPKDSSANRYSEGLRATLLYKNKSDKDIRAFTGYTVFKDLFDREFLRLRLSYEKTLKAGEEIRDKRYIEINEFKDSHRKLRDTELENMKVDFELEAIILTDGTKLQL